MREHIRIFTNHDDDSDYLELTFCASNGSTAGKVTIYVNPDQIIQVASALENFPQTLSEEFVFELGSENVQDRNAYYFLLRVFYTKLSHCAIHIRLNNNESLPDRQIAEFCIQTKTLQLNKLGRRLQTLAKLSEGVIEWSPDSDANT